MKEYISKERIYELICEARKLHSDNAALTMIRFLDLVRREPAADVIPLHVEVKKQ